MLRYAFALILAATPVLAGGLGEMTDDERAAFREEVKAYLLDNPEVLMEAMDVLQTRQQEAAAKADAEEKPAAAKKAPAKKAPAKKAAAKD